MAAAFDGFQPTIVELVAATISLFLHDVEVPTVDAKPGFRVVFASGRPLQHAPVDDPEKWPCRRGFADKLWWAKTECRVDMPIKRFLKSDHSPKCGIVASAPGVERGSE